MSHYLSELAYYPVIMLIYSNVRGEKLKLWEIAIIGLSFFIIDFTWFYTIIGRILILMLLSYLKDKTQPLSLYIFYGSIPWVVESAFKRIISFFIFPMLHINYIDLSKNDGLFIITEISVIIIYFLMVKLSKINFQTFIMLSEVKKLKKVLIFTNTTMIFYYIGIEFLTGMDVYGGVPTLPYRQWLVIFYFIFFILMLSYMNRSYQNWLEGEVAAAREYELHSLSVYSKQIEGLYEELRAFRHDYANILASLKEGIDQNNMDMVRKIYNTVLEESGHLVQNKKFDIGRLINIDNDAVKSLLSAKVLEAESYHIEVELEVKDKIGAPDIPLLDYVRLLSILCDNAIEAALEAEKPAIIIACFYQEDEYILIVENTTKEERVPVELIYHKDYSSRGLGRGIGLKTINKMLKRYSNLSIQTSSKNYHFRQTIVIKKTFD
ncbi:sensor histidine kinase [Streptococcus pantholopis]|uniref:Histidine kinase n=1 Tax=Streptococcus pantholopis TaxID=1811193 RepID=A0A172QAA4_9STRE|nr:GHKL domain-containing protein [Streptococcus pantholopis]AND80394.1 histidine kinase [Streptococcus pantholopis]